jgi:hypothetical protein
MAGEAESISSIKIHPSSAFKIALSSIGIVAFSGFISFPSRSIFKFQDLQIPTRISFTVHLVEIKALLPVAFSNAHSKMAVFPTPILPVSRKGARLPCARG